MKKRMVFLTELIVIVLFLCSCSKPDSDSICYLHAAGFDTQNNLLSMSVVLENSKQSSSQQNQAKGSDDKGSPSESEYFTETFTGISAKECTDKLFKKYNQCYSGQSEVYFLGENLTRNMLYDICVFISSTPSLPAQSAIVTASGADMQKFLKAIQNQNTLDEIKSLTKNDKVNAVKFFSYCTRHNTSVCIPTIKLNSNGKFEKASMAKYRNCAFSEK